MSREIDSRTVMETVGYPIDPVSLKPQQENRNNFSDIALAELYYEGVLRARDEGYAEESSYKHDYQLKAPKYARDRHTDLSQEREALHAAMDRRQQAIEDFLSFFM